MPGKTQEFDYVIVGAGSAGCVLANRLSADPANRVLLLEAGGWDASPWIRIPLGWGRILQRRLFDWGYESEPEPHVGGRRVECLRGRVIGGSSSINAMAYVRGHRSDFDRWAASGLEGWSCDDVLPYFRKQESWEKGADAWRGGDGPLTVVESRYEDPLTDAFIAAGRAAGHPATADYNGAEQEGFARPQSTIRNGRRCSSATAYLHPALRRGNLTVIVGALAERVLLQGGRAQGVDYRLGSKTRRATAAKEVVLSGGVVNTPQLLMLSGIGDPDELRHHGIAVHAPLPGVGQNLQDHLHAPVIYMRNGQGPFPRAMRADRVAVSLAEAYLFGRGFAAEMPGGMVAFLKSEPGLAAPDTQILFSGASLLAKPYLPPFGKPGADMFMCRAVMLRPESRGRIALANADPVSPPRIHFNFLATDRDKAAMRASFRVVRDVGEQAPLRAFVRKEIAPGADIRSDAALDAYIAATAITAHHPLGTCRMGRPGDPLAVVDSVLRVFGVDNLRVVDASVMPDMIGGNINAAVIMIAEKAADMILGHSGAGTPAAVP